MSRDGSGNYARYLQKVWLPIHSQQKCLDLWRGANIDETNLCAAPLDGSTDTCNADSGGPLAQGNTLVGLVSWGPSPCARPNAPGGIVYKNLSKHISILFFLNNSICLGFLFLGLDC